MSRIFNGERTGWDVEDKWSDCQAWCRLSGARSPGNGRREAASWCDVTRGRLVPLVARRPAAMSSPWRRNERGKRHKRFIAILTPHCSLSSCRLTVFVWRQWTTLPTQLARNMLEVPVLSAVCMVLSDFRCTCTWYLATDLVAGTWHLVLVLRTRLALTGLMLRSSGLKEADN